MKVQLPRYVEDRLTVPTFQKGQVNLTSASDDPTGPQMVIWCVANGTVAITWADGGSADNIAMTAGQCLGFDGTASAEISSGTFHIAT